MQLPLDVLDREIELTFANVCEARRELFQTGSSEPCPLNAHRRVSTRQSYLELKESAKDAFSAAIRDWIYVLTLERVLWPDLVRFGQAWHAKTVDLGEARAPRLSPYEVRQALLREVAAERRAFLGDALRKGASQLGDAFRILAERRAEAKRLLDEEIATQADLPCDSASVLQASAMKLLEQRTEPAVAMQAFGDVFAIAVGRDADQGWPARLSTRWLANVFRGTGLLEGLMPRLPKLPDPLGASSFARALVAFGRAFAEAAAPAVSPFALRVGPWDLRGIRCGYLFGALVTEPMFGVRVLGLSPSVARDQARRATRALVTSIRLAAGRLLLRDVVLLSPRERTARFEELTNLALGMPIPPELFGVVPTLSDDDATHFAAMLLAARDRRSMIDRFDEDWFHNPKAAQALREELGTARSQVRTTPADLEVGLRELTLAVVERLG